MAGFSIGGLGLRRTTRDGDGGNGAPPKKTPAMDEGFLEGGEEGVRTPDLSDANAALSQLSYFPSARFVMRGLWPRQGRTSFLSGTIAVLHVDAQEVPDFVRQGDPQLLDELRSVARCPNQISSK